MFKLKHTLIFILFFFLVVTPVFSDIRIVPVIFVADSTFHSRHFPWQSDAKEIVKQLSYIFRETNIQFRIEKMIKIDLRSKNIESDLDYIIQNVEAPENGIIVVLSSKEYKRKILVQEGRAYLGGRHCIVTDAARFVDNYHDLKKEILFRLSRSVAHEICHLFGILHNDTPGALMYKEVNSSAKMNKETVKKILKIKPLAFKKRSYQPEQQK